MEANATALVDSEDPESSEGGLDTVTIVSIVICLIFVPVMLIVFGKLIERKFGYKRTRKVEAHAHPMFDPKNSTLGDLPNPDSDLGES